MGAIEIVVSIATVLGVLISLYSYRRPKPLYYWQLVKLDGVKHPDIKIYFKDQKIPNLYSLRLVFWNAGRKEIRKKDIPKEKAAPRIKLSTNCEILALEATTTTNDKSGEFVKLSSTEYSIKFDYLNTKDALIGELYLKIKDDKDPEIIFLGTLKGAKVSEGDIYNNSKFDKFFSAIPSLLFLAMTGVVGYKVVFSIITKPGFPILLLIGFLFLTALTVLFFQANVLTIPKKIPGKYLYFLNTGNFQN